MKTIITGSRTIKDYTYVIETINGSGFIITEVICGNANGVDLLGERFAKEKGLPISVYSAMWHLHGYGAGPIRNQKMAEVADALILVWDGTSKGSANMLKQAEAYGLKIHQLIV